MGHNLLDTAVRSRVTMRLSSPVFEDRESIPDKYGYEKENVNPPLEIGGVPTDAASLALVIDDPDAQEPAGQIWDHWVVWDIDPDVDEINEGSTPSGAREGRNDFGETSYGGPRPPDREHTYHFRLYALDSDLELDAGASKDDLRERVESHIIDETELRGTYTPN
jgi:Raf kinase inhibitor-like YbhB/YbcL family protein